jgi:hypothetical protein
MLTLMLAPTLSLLAAAPGPGPAGPLSRADAVAGWRDLSSGPDAASHWRGYRQPSFPAKGWTVADGVITHAAGGGGGDLVTVDQFGDFEFTCRFRTAPKANSGIIYRVAEKHDAAWMTGPEFQVLDDAGAGQGPDSPHSCGSMYDLFAPAAGKQLRPAGEWNDARIRLCNGVVQHWINGSKVVEARLFDDASPAGRPVREWLDRIAASKFKSYDGFGLQPRGHIALQDHGDEVAYRDVRARDLGAPMPGEVRLFNGRDLEGWHPVLSGDGRPEDVWHVKDGVLVCSGNPVGYIRTTADYTNFVLRLEWRFNPETKKAGNSGVLLRMVGPDKVWPRSIEAQLHSGNAGDFWNIDEFRMTTDPARTSGRNTRKTHAAERPVGEWNDYEIIVNRGDVILKVNGEEVNRATDAEELAGKICLQSEGAEIHFRNIRLAPLD